MISFLTVIDNPRQDIPLMAVLKSVFGGFDDYELSLIRCADPEGQLFDALKASAGDATSPVGKRAEQFLRTLEHYRDMTLDRPIHEIIECIMEDFHYDLAAGAGGEGAVMNLRLLIRKAADFEETSYRGLFHFIRYLEQLKKYEYDPEDGVQEGDENAVHVMSIHRSKGLEFPVVFLCALQKRFNLKDAASAMVTDSTLGIGIDRFDPDWSLQWPTLLKSLISARRVLLSKSEELRVLYVAMTRAKERLIMSGVVKDAEKSAGKDLVDPSYASSFLEVLLFVIDPEQKDFPICLKNVSLEELALTEAAEQFREEERSLAVQELFSAEPETQEPDEETRRLEKQLFWKDLREDINRIPAKTAVTSFTERFDPEDERKLRMLQAEEDEASSGQDVAKTRGEAGKKNSAGALRGLAYHKALELVDIKSIQSAPQAEAYLASLVQTGILEAAAAKMVNPEDIAVYCKTALAGRMGKAAQEGRLSREQPFIISRSARILDDSFPEDQEILIQGIIDAFFYEDDGIVVVDYKTDHVDREEVLKQRYAEQLAFYASALEQLTGKRVKEKIIYSVFLGKEIPL